MSLETVLIRAWKQQSTWLWGLAPLSWLYKAVFALNKFSHDFGIKPVYHAPVPVIIIGNISVGGSGKTPFIIALIAYLQELGVAVAVISRGYGGQADKMPLLVTADLSSDVVGDEPALIVQKTGVAMAVSPNRQQAIELLLEHHPNLKLILSDDGLQHHALYRDAEWIVVDAVRGFGNRQLLPMGYLREPVSRLLSKNINGIKSALLFNMTGWENQVKQPSLSKLQQHLLNLAPNLHTLAYLNQKDLKNAKKMADVPTMNLHGNKVISLSTWANQTKLTQTSLLQTLPAQTVIAMTGIGYPERFFNSLSKLGFMINPVALPDHHHYTMADFMRLDERYQRLPIVVTEKDAIKILDLLNKSQSIELQDTHLNSPNPQKNLEHWRQKIWVLPVMAELSTAVYQQLRQQLQMLAIL